MNQNNDISVYQLFKKLQYEYIICILRARIYPIIVHKNYWKDLANKKKEKINDIEIRNNIISIFTSPSKMDDYKKEIYGEKGLPKFYYPNKKRESIQKYWDAYNYFYPGSEVSFKINSKIEVGIVDKIDYDSKLVLITIIDSQKNITLSFNEVTRIM